MTLIFPGGIQETINQERPVSGDPLNRELISWHMAGIKPDGAFWHNLIPLQVDVDDSVNRNDGLLQGGTVPGDFHNKIKRPEAFGQGISFPGGTSARVRIGTWFPASNRMTVSAWVFLTGTAGVDGRFVSKANGNAERQHNFMIGYTGGDIFRCRFNRADATTTMLGNSPFRPSDFVGGPWFHLLATKGANAGQNTGQMYLNGINRTDVSADHEVAIAWNNGDPIYIGNNPVSLSESPNCTIDDVRVWNRALSDEEVYSVYKESLESYTRTIDRTSIFVPGVSIAPTGEILDADPGTFSLTGVVANTEVGHVLAADTGTFALTGEAAATLVGHVLVAEPFSSSGFASASFSTGFSTTKGFVVTGVVADTLEAEILVAAAGSFVLTGVNADTRKAETLNADTGTFALTGEEAATTVGQVIAADTGSFVLTGVNAGVNIGFVVDAVPGTFVLTGVVADTKTGLILTADAGIFALTGEEAGTQRDIFLAADVGTFALTGVDADVLEAHLLTADAGSFVLTGVFADTSKSGALSAVPGLFNVTGASANLLVGKVLAADFREFVVVGENAATTAGSLLEAQTGSFVLTGVEATTSLPINIMQADTGVFSLTGVAANTLLQGSLSADTGTFSLTGVAAGVNAGFVVDAVPATFSVSGQAAATLVGQVIDAAPGTLALTGEAAATLVGEVLFALEGTFVLTGVAADTRFNPHLAAETGVFVLAGQNAELFRTQSTGVTTVSKLGMVATAVRKGGVASSRVSKLARVGGNQVAVFVPGNITLVALGGTFDLTGENAATLAL